MSKDKDIDMHDPVVLFSANAEDLMAIVTYEGDIGAHEPNEIHLDTENKTLSVVFENGQEEKICDLTQENIDAVSRLYSEFRANQKEVIMGFYQVDGEQKLKNPCYNVSVLVM